MAHAPVTRTREQTNFPRPSGSAAPPERAAAVAPPALHAAIAEQRFVMGRRRHVVVKGQVSCAQDRNNHIKAFGW